MIACQMVRFMSIRLNGFHSSGHPPAHLVDVNGKWISRSPSSEPDNTFVGEFTKEIKDSVLTDPKSRHVWKPFTSDFNPDAVNAVKANHGLGWIGSDVYVGKVNDVLGTIYKTVGSTWKLQVMMRFLMRKKVNVKFCVINYPFLRQYNSRDLKSWQRNSSVTFSDLCCAMNNQYLIRSYAYLQNE
ncbi:hypothetical protein Ocin01_17728 [Orchesella cincta]|uniref:Uncharacterized protein n=1 Tax=Orchesella cincta TaxID=48709 RepID=A0A1D2M7R1_ORCCI|nr:hypothetical protein Ocin01_17728 [Orchesella cincta]